MEPDQSYEALPVLTFDIGCVSSLGGRDTQEDAFSMDTRPRGQNMLERKGAIFIVADGVSGRTSGEVASQMAVSLIKQSYYGEGGNDVGGGLRRAMITCNQAILHRAHEQRVQGMATTVVCAVVRGNELTIAHVGDSRAYLYHDNTLRLLTRDHSWVQEQIDAGILSEAEAAVHPQRNVITRSLGNQARVTPEILHPVHLCHNDRILLCTDGLYDVVRSEDILSVFSQCAPQEACQTLVNLSMSRGNTDNITVIVAEAHYS